MREAAARLGVEPVDGGLVADLRALHAEVEHDDAGDQRDQRGAPERERRPAEEQRQQEAGERAASVSSVGERAGERRDQRPGGAGEAEQADDGLVVAVGGGAEQEGDRRPQHGEAAEAERPERHALAQHGLARDQREHGAQGRCIARRLGLRHRWQPPPQDERQREHRDGGEREHEPPAAHLGDEPAERSGREDADEQAAHDRADDLSALLGAGERGRERHDDLRDHGQRAGGGERDGEHAEAGRGGARGERDGGAEQDRRDQPPAFHDVAERHEEREAADVADLRARDEQPGGAVGHAQRVPDGVEQRLYVVEVGDGRAACDGEQRDEPARHARGRVRVIKLVGGSGAGAHCSYSGVMSVAPGICVAIRRGSRVSSGREVTAACAPMRKSGRIASRLPPARRYVL